MPYRWCHKRCDGAIEGFRGVIEGATELGDFDGHRRCDGVIEGFDGVKEGATVSYRRCHGRFDGAWRFRRCHRRFDGAWRFRRCHERCGGVIEGFDGPIKPSSRLLVPPQVIAGSRKVRTDLARKIATAASIDQILFSIVVMSVSSRVCCFPSCCGAFVFRLPGVSRLAVLVS